MGDAGEIDLGQLVRERHGNDAFLIGQTTHHGTVTAAPDWGEPARHYHVQPGLEGSCEALFHQVGIDAFTLPLGGSDPRLDEPLLQRAIGVIYRPETERTSHYFETRLARQFDAVIHIDRTSALQPLDQLPEWNEGDAPEGYPFAGEPLPGGR
jgi:erythromycin esterase-like protein